MRLACWQAAVRNEDSTQLVRRLATVAERARDAGADLLVTPELSLTGHWTSVRDTTRAAHEADERVGQAARIAAHTGIALVCGYPEKTVHGTYNTAELMDSDGTILAGYRKTRLYGSLERSAFTAGEDCVVQGRIAGLTVGLLICYDLEFPEIVRAHALRGTAVLVVPAALARPGEFVANTLVPARAFENQIYLAYSNWSGFDGEMHYCGLSRVADPHGRVSTVAETGDHLLVADINAAEIDAARAATPYLVDRRPRLYETCSPNADRTPRRRGNTYDAAHPDPVTMLVPDFPFADDDWVRHPAGLGRLPRHRNGTAVAVVGGGLSGLVAAYELMRLGLRPVVDEAGELGGRMRSVRFAENPGYVAELGAMRFSPSAKTLFHYVNELGLQARPVPNPQEFVAFSTTTPLLGSSHLSGYPAASAAMNAMMQVPRRRGQPATTVHWGPFADGLAGTDREWLIRASGLRLLPTSALAATGAVDVGPADVRAVDMVAADADRTAAGSLVVVDADWPAMVAAITSGGRSPEVIADLVAAPTNGAHHHRSCHRLTSAATRPRSAAKANQAKANQEVTRAIYRGSRARAHRVVPVSRPRAGSPR